LAALYNQKLRTPDNGKNMFIFANLLAAVAMVLNAVLEFYFWVVIIAAVMSWFSPDPYNPIVNILRSLTEPVFYRLRKWLPFLYINRMDLSPIVLILFIKFIQVGVISSLAEYAARLKISGGLVHFNFEMYYTSHAVAWLVAA
jgi:YggT family protein